MSNSMTVKALFEKYVAEHEEGLARTTIEGYRSGVTIFARFLERDGTIEDLTKETLFRYADWLVATYESKSTAASNFRCIKALTLFAAREELIKPIVKMRRIKIPSKNPTAWTDEECRSLINTALTGKFVVDGWSELPNGPSKGLFFACLFAVSWDTSLRLGDQLGLKWSDLTIDKDGSARAVIAQNKTGNLVPISLKAETVKLLETLRDAYHERQENLFVYPYAKEQLFYCVRKIVNAAGVTKGTLRFLRRGSATYAELKQPGAGKVALGHRSSWTSETYYLDQNILAQRNLDKPNVLAVGENGNPLVVVEDIPQGDVPDIEECLKSIDSQVCEEVVAGRLVYLCYSYNDSAIPDELPEVMKTKLLDYQTIALENLYDGRPIDRNATISKIVKADMPDHPRFGHVVSAKIDGKLVGVAQFHDDGLIHNLAVHPDHRRKGVGTTLVREIFRRCERVEAYTRRLTEGAMAFAKSVGFQNPPSDTIVIE